MKRCIGIVALLMLSIASATSADPPLVPKGPPPLFVTAQIVGKDGDKVVFMRSVTEPQTFEKDGKTFGRLVTVSFPVTVVYDEKEVQAFGTDGKKLKRADVVKQLAKSTPAVIFHGDPDSYYLQFLREGTVVFNAPPEKCEPPPPAPKK